eukprot:10119962-Alexandrium_andersonii.AAC.1
MCDTPRSTRSSWRVHLRVGYASGRTGSGNAAPQPCRLQRPDGVCRQTRPAEVRHGRQTMRPQ